MRRKKILIKRNAGHGDVLLATGILSALKKKWPESQINFSTACGHVLFGNPYLDAILNRRHRFCDERRYDLVIHLDYAYEIRPMVPIWENYANEAKVSLDTYRPYIRCDAVPMPLPKFYVVMHAGKTTPWSGRDWPRARFAEIVRRLRNEGLSVIAIGNQRLPPLEGAIDLENKLTVQQMATVIAKAAFFVGIDSFPMHVAQTVGTPGVAFFGSVLPHLRLFSDLIHPITAAHLPCLGCHNRNCPSDEITTDCIRGDRACEQQLDVAIFWEQLRHFLLKSLHCGQHVTSLSESPR